MKEYLFLIIILLFNLQIIAQNPNQMFNPVTVNITAGKPSFPVEGVAPVILEVKNETAYEISVLLPYPNPNNLTFHSLHLNRKKTTTEPIERTAPTYIAAGETYREIYYLNRYFFLKREGSFEINYQLDITIEQPNTAIDGYHFEGSFVIQIVKKPTEDLKKQYAFYAEHLTSSDPHTREKAGEALSFLDTPLCIEYVIPMLSVSNLEIPGIKALSRFKTARTEKAILGMLSHTSSAVVSEAIQALESMQVTIERRYFLQMLSSTNASIRYTGLLQLEKKPDKNDRPLIEPLCNDLNTAVASKAKSYFSILDNPAE